MIKALQIEKENLTRFRSVEAPVLGEGQVRVCVRHVGLCGSDLNTFKGLNPLVQLPRIPGHEIGGEILAAGPGVDPAYRPGRRVIVMPYTNCGRCSSCRKGRLNACRYNKTLGVQQDGGLAEEIVLPAEKLILNETLKPRHLALVEPLSVGFHAVERGRLVAGETVAEAKALLELASTRLAWPVRQAPAPDLDALARLAVDSSYTLPEDPRLHDAATDLESCRIAAGGSLYPDHVIFLGKGSEIAGPNETAASIEARHTQEDTTASPTLLFPGKGVLVRKDITAGALAMARCLSDVTLRIPEAARLRYLSPAENAELLGWDAEKYRQALNRAGQVLQ